MRTILLSIVEMSLTSAVLIMILIAFRPVLKKFPAWIRCGIWAMPAVRLICPFSIKSCLSIIPDWKGLKLFKSAYDKSSQFSDNAVNTYQFGDSTLNISGSGIQSAGSSFDYIQLLCIIWIIGIAVIALYVILSTIHLKRLTSASIEMKENVFICDEIDTPFVSGIIKPKIYIPSGLDVGTMKNAEAHEKAHIKRLDYLWKILAFAVLALHWFNPLVWLGYIIFCRDIEMACDEKVVKALSQDEIVKYSQSVLNCSIHKRGVFVYTVGFGKIAVKYRVKHILDYRSPSFKIIAASILFCIVFMGMFMTNPFIDEENNTVYSLTGDNKFMSKNCEEYIRTVENRDGNGQLVSVLKYSYDKNGILDEMTVQDSEGNLISGRKYVLDDNGWISESEEYDADGKLIAISQYTRDRNGNELTCKESYVDGTFCWWNEYKYDAENNPVEYVRYKEDGSIYYTWKSRFNDLGKETERICSDSNGNEMWSRTFGYNNENELIYTEQYSSDGRLESRTDYKMM